MVHDIRHILVPIDLSDSSTAALRYAKYFAERLLAPISVMYADTPLYPVDILPLPDQLPQLRQEITDYAKEALEHWPFNVIVKVGPVASMIVATAEEIDARLIVIGSHHHRAWRHALTGSVSADVIHSSNCPVLAVDGKQPPSVTRILCPINFTDVARESLRFAARLAELFAAELLVVHVIESGHDAIDEARVREWIAPEMREATTFRELVLRGGPAERVLDCAEDLGADLLVVGAQHKLFRDDTVIGTTTERLIRFANCPVLTFPRALKRVKNAERERETAAVGD